MNRDMHKTMRKNSVDGICFNKRIGDGRKKVSMGVQLREKPVVKMTKERPPRNRESEPGRAKKAQKKEKIFAIPQKWRGCVASLGILKCYPKCTSNMRS